jgi:hypothetical protein
MKVSEEFPSQYLEAADLRGREVTVTITKSEKHDGVTGRDGRKFDAKVIYFEGKKKGMCLNKTNARRIRDVYGYGDDSDNWKGKEITLYPTTCNAFGNPKTPCIRVKIELAGGVK